MLCSCRTAPLRSFVRSLTQLHSSNDTATQLIRPPTWRIAARHGSQTTQLASRWRALHSSAIRCGEEPGISKLEPSSAPKAVEPPQEPTEESEAPARVLHSRAPKADAITPATSEIGVETKNGKESRVSAREGPTTSKAARSKRSKSRAEDRPVADDWVPPPREAWQVQKAALKEKFPDGWQPKKRLSPDALAGIRALHEQFPDEYPTEVLAQKFQVSPEAIRRILKSKWTPSAEEEVERQERWLRRGESVWQRYAGLGMKPPRKWRARGIVRDPSYHEERRARIAARKALEEMGNSPSRKLANSLV